MELDFTQWRKEADKMLDQAQKGLNEDLLKALDRGLPMPNKVKLEIDVPLSLISFKQNS